MDALQGLGANRDFGATEEAILVYSGTAIHPYVDDSNTLTLAITNNTVNSARVLIDLYVALGA